VLDAIDAELGDLAAAHRSVNPRLRQLHHHSCLLCLVAREKVSELRYAMRRLLRTIEP
jgi:hypothetical protein